MRLECTVRQKKQLSNEQTAEMRGLGLWTIRRVEGGHRMNFAMLGALVPTLGKVSGAAQTMGLSQMKCLQITILLVLLTSCDANREAVNPEAQVRESVELTGSFNMRNGEIREEFLAELVKQDIQHWINEDGSIRYLRADGEIIDEIGNEIRMAYIRRN